MTRRDAATPLIGRMRVSTIALPSWLAVRLTWPLVAAFMGGGLLLIALADAASRAGAPLAVGLFWLGFLVLMGPAAWRLVSPSPSDAADGGVRRRSTLGVAGRTPTTSERVAIVLGLGLALYLVKVMTNPTMFVFPDEYSHLRTLADIQRTGHLFSENPLLPVSPIYPGLEAATSTVIATTGLSAVHAAYVLVGLARGVLVLALFLLARSITRSSRAAAIACLIYMANPSFLMFTAAFSYESLALPLAVVAIWATHRMVVSGRLSVPLAFTALGATTATIATHHVTSFVLLGFLSLWAAIWVVRDRGRTSGSPLGLTTVWAWGSFIGWHIVAGPAVASYLLPVFQRGFLALIRVLTGDAEPKPLFAATGGVTTPVPEMLAAYAAVGLLVLTLPFVLLHALRFRRPSAIVLVLVVGAALYPPSLALRLTALGSETSQRASEFLFLGLGILGAMWLTDRHAWRWRPTRTVVVAPILVLLIAGGIATGAPANGRLPGPYRVAAESRSYDPQGFSAAEWALRWLGPGHRMITDRTNAKLMAGVGLQHPVTSSNSGLGTAWVMFASELGPAQLDVLREGRIEFIVVDLRLSRDPPFYPFYFEAAEPEAGRHVTPIPLSALTKFDTEPLVTRVYDSGDIVIYDVRRLVDELG